MEKAKIIEELQKRFGEKLFLDSADVAKALGTTKGALASMKHRGGFTCPMSKIGGKLVVSVFDFAEYVADGYKEPTHPTQKHEIKEPARKSERYQALGFALREQMNFFEGVFSKIEEEILLAEIDEAAKKSDD